MPPSCALLGGFAIGARVSLLCQHITEREMSVSACTRSMPGCNIHDDHYSCQNLEITRVVTEN